MLSLVFFVAARPSLAQSRLLALYKSSEGVNAENNEIHTYLAPILERLGWQVDYHDVLSGLPPESTMKKYGAVVAWYRGPVMPNALNYVAWLRDQLTAGRRVVLFGNFGAHNDGTNWLSPEQLNVFFQPFGLDYEAQYSNDPSQIKVASKDSQMVESELPIPSPPPLFVLFKSPASNHNYLVLERKDLPDSQSAMVVTTPKGGMAQELYLLEATNDGIQWHLDREDFLMSALGHKMVDHPVSVAPSPAPAPVAAPVPVPQSPKLPAGAPRILGLFRSSEGASLENNEMRLFAEKPLAELGYALDYYDIDQGLPTPDKMAGYKGVMTWYRSPTIRGAKAYIEWLLNQILAGRKVVIMGNLGVFHEMVQSDKGEIGRFLLGQEYNRFLYPFGLEFRADWTNDKKTVQVAQRDQQMVPFLPPDTVGHYQLFRSVDPRNQAYLTLRRSDQQESESAVIVRTPYGGMALESYIFYQEPTTYKVTMHLDMKRFLNDCLTFQAGGPPKKIQLTVTPSALAGPRNLEPPAYPADVKPLQRRVLAFYQRDKKEVPRFNSAHTRCQTVLDYLGVAVDYRPVEDPLPTDAEMEKYLGVLTWFTEDNMVGAHKFNDWLAAQMKAGRKVVILGTYAAASETSDRSLTDPRPVFAQLGLSYSSVGNTPTLPGTDAFNKVELRGQKIVKLDESMMNWEEKVDLSAPDLVKAFWPSIRSVDPKNKVYLTLADSRGEADVVVISPHGAVAMGNFPGTQPKGDTLTDRVSGFRGDHGQDRKIAEDEETIPAAWRLDPFKFFTEAFELEDMPRPDMSTLNGHRIFYSHIDGDAFRGISLTDRVSLNGEVMYREVLSKYPLPVTVSYVTADIEKYLGDYYCRELSAAREIMDLDNIEPASHTQTHPFDWQHGDMEVVSKDPVRLERRPIDLNREIHHSIDFINQALVPADKHCRILLWSGRCNPTPEALKLVREMGIPNLNGGDPLYDSKQPYMMGVYPLYTPIGDGLQVHTAGAGDFIYTGSFTRNYDGLKKVVETYEKTEKPRRLRPMNAYYHFYLAEREPALESIAFVYDYVLAHDPAPMFASDQVDIVNDFYHLRMGRTADGGYWIGNLSDLRELRFENRGQVPDLTRSKGVLGYLVEGDTLWVHLDEGEQHRVYLRAPGGQGPYLRSATHYVSQWKAQGENVSLVMTGVGQAKLELSGLAPGKSYKLNGNPVTSDAQGTVIWTGRLRGYRASHSFKLTP
ncbi:MAG: DUF2194 domain-containing protein [Candidatus Eremiobacteraeota bacterium]|nr:DUF2194 domain-containing protein [Candidatus Eremiobacteraeota bacterium]